MTASKPKAFQLIKYVFSDLLEASKFWFFIDLAANISISVFALLTTLMFQAVFNKIEQLLSGRGTIHAVVLAAMALCFSLLMKSLVTVFCSYTGTGALAQKATGLIRSKIHKNMQKIRAEDFEDVDMLDHINRVNESAVKGYGVYGGISLIFTYYLPYILWMTVYLFILLPRLALMVLIIFLVQILSQAIRYRFFVDLEEKAAPIRRAMEEYQMYLYDSRYYKDTILNDSFDMFLERYRKKVLAYNFCVLRHERRNFMLEIAMKAITLAGYAGSFFLLYEGLGKGLISIGAFAAVFGNLNSMFGMINGMITFPLKRLSEALAVVNEYYTFMNRAEDGGQAASYSDTDIILDQVCFAYPNSQKNVLKDITLHIRKGEVIALVGRNGAGKSTLAKLLMGLYTPTSGHIMGWEAETANRTKEAADSGVTAVFQNFQKYKLTFAENIQISDFDKREDIAEVVAQAGVDVEKNRLDRDVVLSKEFGGIDISGGEWQRIAIARALYREHAMIVLDEPTAAIDPLEESRIYREFAQISEGKTTILVTHRLGSVKLADRILVLQRGEVAEQGTHEELMESRGAYYKMYMEQKKWYR